MNLKALRNIFSSIDHQKLKKFLQNDFVIAFLFLSAYLLTSPYIYGWDDQHLEIPILKHLIDPSLYKGDYYVESATKYFTCWLYPILAKLITVKQIPAVYLVLFLISRYAMFYWVYRLWKFISGSYFTAVCTTAMFFLLGRTDEFLYRSFCHEEFAFIFMFAGIYCFYRERYLAAAIIFGLGVNFHAIYNLFPMVYMAAYLLLLHPQRFKMVFQTGLAYVIMAMPFLLWQIPISISREVAHPVPPGQWIPLYFLGCPQNFLFGDAPLNVVFSNANILWDKGAQYLFLTGLYLFNLVLNPVLRKDKKIHVIMCTSLILLTLIYFLDYVHPERLVVDLNLARLQQYMRFFMMGYTTVWACHELRHSKPWLTIVPALLLIACATTDQIGLFFLGALSMFYVVDAIARASKRKEKIFKEVLFLMALGYTVIAMGTELDPQSVMVYCHRFMYVIGALVFVYLAIMIKYNNQLWLRLLLIIVPLTGQFIVCLSNAIEYYQLQENGPGPWVMLRDWKDMQLFVRDHTPKDALFLTPYDMPMGGFRIHSDRKPLVCYRDCGIIGFDFQAAKEWYKRIKDIEKFKIYTNDRVDETVLRAILKYNIDYIVFMKYYGPREDSGILKKIYENEVFSLYQVV